MINETRFTIGELADAADVTTRTIRYYTAEGLLPPPETRGRLALYTTDHLRRLRLIGRLKDAYLPLSEIRARLEQLSSAQVERLLAEYDQPPEAPSPSSAADYIAQVLTTQNAPPAPRMLAESPTSYAESSAPAASVGFRPPLASGAASPPMPAPIPPAAPAPQVGRAGAAVPAPAAASQGGVLRKLIPQRRERAAEPQASAAAEPEERWRRVTLAPGVELHLRESPAPALRERIERLIGFARELFGGSQPEEH